MPKHVASPSHRKNDAGAELLPGMKHLIRIVAILWFIFGPLVGLALAAEADGAATLAVHEVPKDARVTKLSAYLTAHDSPLASEASHFVAEADRFSLDWRLVPAISGVESTFGKFVPSGSYNGWGWGIPTGAQSGVGFRDWKEGITMVSEGLRTNYLDRGATTIEQIGRIYAASPRWAGNVRFFLAQIEAFQPNHSELLDITI